MDFEVGIDLVDLISFRSAVDEQANFTSRWFHTLELNYSINSLAGSLAAKEALYKACNMFSTVDPRLVAILRTSSGKPFFHFEGTLEEVARNYRFALSITHTDLTVCAVVFALSIG